MTRIPPVVSEAVIVALSELHLQLGREMRKSVAASARPLRPEIRVAVRRLARSARRERLPREQVEALLRGALRLAGLRRATASHPDAFTRTVLRWLVEDYSEELSAD